MLLIKIMSGKLKARLEWVYQVACENNQKEVEHHKKYYDRKIRSMSLRPDDLVLVHVKAPTGDHKLLTDGKQPHIMFSVNWQSIQFLKFNQGMLKMMKISECYIETCSL